MFLYEPLHKSEQIGGQGFRICVLEFFCFVIYNLYFVNHLEFCYVVLDKGQGFKSKSESNNCWKDVFPIELFLHSIKS